MSRPRVVLATKSYWPQLSESARTCERLAAGLSRCGAEVHVLTAQCDQGLQGTYWDGPVPVTRLPHGPNSWWGPMRYWFALADWLKSHREAYDIVCVSGLHYDAYSASQALDFARQRLVLRAEAAGPAGDCLWQATARFGGRVKQRCQQAHAIVAAAPAIEAELTDAGYDPTQITVIESGLDLPAMRTAATREAARETLRNAHASLRISKYSTVILCTSEITSTEQLPPLLDFWKRVVQRMPAAVLWMIGQGRLYDVIPRLAERHGLELSVAAPGMFDDLTEVYEAADLLLLPFDTGGQTIAALEALAIGVPVITADTPGNRRLAAELPDLPLIALDETSASIQFESLLADTLNLAATVDRLRTIVQQRHSVERIAEEHLALFERLLDDRSELASA